MKVPIHTVKLHLIKFWNAALHIGFDDAMEYTKQMKLLALNAFLLLATILTLFFVGLFVLLESYSALQGLLTIPVYAFVFYLNSKRRYNIARLLVTYGLMVLILALALVDRRTGTEYILIAIGCCAVGVFNELTSVLISFLFAFAFYAFYVWFDATHPFIANPTVPYIFIQNALMFFSGFAVMAQSLAFRSLINRYSTDLKLANQEIKSVNEELKTSNEELLTFSEQLDLMVKQKSAELQAYLDAINITLFSATTDWDGEILRVNDPLIEATGYTAQELIGQNCRMFSSGDDAESFFENVHKIGHSGKSWRGEVKSRKKDGSAFWVDMVVIPVKRQHELPSYLLILALSISERKELEEKNSKAVSALESVAFRTSHEIRGPLTRIMGLTSLLKRDFVDKAELPYVTEQLVQSSKELDLATHDLTAFINKYQGNHDIKQSLLGIDKK